MDHLEVYICTNCENGSHSITFDEESHRLILKQTVSAFKTKKYALFKKHILKVFHDNMVLENTYDDITTQKLPVKENVYTLSEKTTENTIYEVLIQDKTVLKYYSKQVRPQHNFPSTTKIYDMLVEDKTIFKINNILYLNFSIVTYKSDPNKKYHYIYMNYNDNDKCDIKMNTNIMTDIIKTLSTIISK